MLRPALSDVDDDVDSVEIDELLAHLEEQDSSSSLDVVTKSAQDLVVHHSCDPSYVHNTLETGMLHTRQSKALSKSDNAPIPHPSKPPQDHASYASQASPPKNLQLRSTSSPPSPSCFGLSCFCSKRGKKRQKESYGRGSKAEPKVRQTIDHDTYEEEWEPVLEKVHGPGELDPGLFDVNKAEREFRRVSMKEKQLTREAQEFLKTVARS